MSTDGVGNAGSPPAGSQMLLNALKVINGLRDSEQYLLAMIMRGDWPQLDSLIARATLLDLVEREQLISKDIADSFRRIADAAWSTSILTHDERDALHYWFGFGDRSELHALGVLDGAIGSVRIIPDDIWPQEQEYSRAKDGTLIFGGTASAPVATMIFGQTWIDWPELYKCVLTALPDR